MKAAQKDCAVWRRRMILLEISEPAVETGADMEFYYGWDMLRYRLNAGMLWRRDDVQTADPLRRKGAQGPEQGLYGMDRLDSFL